MTINNIEAFENNNVPDGYDADTYIIVCPHSKEFQASPETVCPESVELS